MNNLKNLFIPFLLYGTAMFIFFYFQSDLKIALLSAGCASVIFCLGLYFFSKSKRVNKQTSLANEEYSDLLYAEPANHFLNNEGVGGKLYLLVGKLIFKSHHFNIQNHTLEIPLDQISSVQFYNSLKIIPNGLSLVLTNGKTEKFVVHNRQMWKAQIESAMNDQDVID